MKRRDDPAALKARAAALLDAGDVKAAARDAARGIALAPADAELHGLKGLALARLGETDAAVVSLRRWADLAAAPAAAHHEIGRTLLRAGQASAAIPALQVATAFAPASAEAWCDLGAALEDTGARDAAVTAYDRALAIRPGFAVALHNRANALRRLGRHDDAAAGYAAAIASDAGFAPALNALASIEGERGRLDVALDLLARAETAAPKLAEVKQNKATLLLRYGRLAEGYDLYDWRFQPSPRQIKPRPYGLPFWQGEDLRGKRLLVWTEQGLGDEILAAGMIGDLIARGADCTIECSARLQPLFARSFPVAVIAREDQPIAGWAQQFDLQSPAASLGRFVRREASAYPVRPSYLRADPVRTAALRARYRSADRPAIGFAWDSTALLGSYKQVPATVWRDAFAGVAADLVSLQYGVGPSEVAAMATRLDRPLTFDPTVDPLADVDGWAAQIAALDAVVSLSNSTVHLAGALGVPTHAVLAAGPGTLWYWFRDRADSPWYPALRLHRQGADEPWPAVMARVNRALREAAAGA